MNIMSDEYDTYPRRKSPRADFHDYSCGDYFVTICTNDKRHYFGEVDNGEMRLSAIGEFVDAELAGLSSHYPYSDVLMWVVMPNHLHAIIHIDDETTPHVRSALSVVVGGLKRSVTMYARRNNIEFGWQSRYHDHIIRKPEYSNKIAEYIRNNPFLWSKDCFNDEV